MRIYTTFLDQTDHTFLSPEVVTEMISRLRPEELEYANGGYFEYRMKDGAAIILFFVARTPDQFSFRYDYNVPDARNGTAWYSVTDAHTRTVIDAGDEQYVPLVSFVSLPVALEIVMQFFRQPEEKSAAANWQQADFFDWPY
ncbi:hypothetical protein [Chitinophaga eiseniae]|nr:hypothetical protein [Chitinophaga eiseniae]